MDSKIDVSTQECYTLVKAKQHVEQLMGLTNKLERSTYVTKLLNQLYKELDYQHEVRKNPDLLKITNDSWLD
tara:strand:+ start:204 stop:419 length:216 start_codon:yes stop_codon:yes gene_type:complete